LREAAEAESGRLLRVLLIRDREVPAGPGIDRLLRRSSTMKVRPIRRDWILIGFFLLGGFLTLWCGSVDIYGHRAFARGEAKVDASVTAHELNPCRGFDCGPPYRLQYKFLAASSQEYFSYTGQYIFFGAWVRVPEATWRDALGRGTVQIRYSQYDPRINEPTATSHYSRIDGWGLAGLAMLEFACAIWIFRIGRRNRVPLPDLRSRDA